MGEVSDEYAAVAASAKRWRRFGLDRLYVNAVDGSRIGWVDLETGERLIELPELTDAFDSAVGQWEHEQPTAMKSTTTTLTPQVPAEPENPRRVEVLSPLVEEPSPERVLVPMTTSDAGDSWLDLSKNLPGEAVRAQATAARHRQPVLTRLARVARVHTDERAWRIGAKGEQLVAKELTKLPAGWHNLNAIPIGDNSADIDHLVIGPAGVFSLNAKHHNRSLSVCTSTRRP
jgi:hypothetical protein